MACARLLRLRLLVVLVRRFRIWTPSAAVSALLRARRRQPAKLATRQGVDTASVTLQKPFFHGVHYIHYIHSDNLILSLYVLTISYHSFSSPAQALRLGTASFTFSTSTTPLRPRAKALASPGLIFGPILSSFQSNLVLIPSLKRCLCCGVNSSFLERLPLLQNLCSESTAANSLSTIKY